MTNKIDFSKFELVELSDVEKILIDGGGDGIGKKIGHAIGWFFGQVVNGAEQVAKGAVWIHDNFKQPPELIGVK